MTDDGVTSGADCPAQVLQKIAGAPARDLRRKGVDYQAALLALIDEFLAGKLTFDDLERRFTGYFIDEMHDDDISAESLDFFSRVHEKLSWTGPDVDKESRGYGWIDPAEFSQWLGSQRAAFYPRGASA